MYGHILIIQEKWKNYHFICVQLYLSRNSNLNLDMNILETMVQNFFTHNLKS